MKPSLLLLLLLGAGCTAESAAPVGDLSWLDESDIEFDAPIPTEAEYAESRVLVGFLDEQAPERVTFGGLDLSRARAFPSLAAGVYEVEQGADVRALVEDLRATGHYRWVEPDYVRYASTTNDPYRTYQWNFDAVDAEGAWAYGTGAGAVVAIIDTGVSSGPYDGISNLGVGYDFVNGDGNPADDNGHGSHVAGTVAQATNNGSGVTGLAHGASIMPVKVLDRFGSGYSSDIVAGIDYAVANGADVMNLSLGSSYYSSTEAAAILDAYNAGVFVAAASGNEGSGSVSYPAAYTGAVAVGATRYGNALASYSNTGSALDLVAPGGDTSRDDNRDGYADGILQETHSSGSWGYHFFQGTSMASPHVAAAAALLMGNGATNAEAETYLASNTLDLGAAGWDASYGYGLIQPAAALAAWAGSAAPATDADGDGYADTTDCDDANASVFPGATETCGDGIDQDCDGADAACSSAPTISGASYTFQRNQSVITWSTDEATTGRVCNTNGDCASTSLGTSHRASIHKRGSGFTIVATDVDGEQDTETVLY